MRKALALILALVFMLSMAGTAFASESVDGTLGGLFVNTGNIASIEQNAAIIDTNVAIAKKGDAKIKDSGNNKIVQKAKIKQNVKYKIKIYVVPFVPNGGPVLAE